MCIYNMWTGILYLYCIVTLYTAVGSTGNDIVGVTASGLEMAADASTGQFL